MKRAIGTKDAPVGIIFAENLGMSIDSLITEIETLSKEIAQKTSGINEETPTFLNDLIQPTAKFYLYLQAFIKAKQQKYKIYKPNLGKYASYAYTPDLNATPPSVMKKGFGMVKNHRVMKPAVMPNKPLKIGRGQMKKDELQFQVDLEKAKKKRGQPKAITGKGVCVEVPEDTYKTFGKHIIHYPQLRDMNTLNVKYPSKSKNYVPKLVVSAYYKDLMMDLLERGKYSDTLLDKLEESEKEHFHKIVKGAGLLEQFKLKTPSNDKTKQSAERFKVLRGNFLAGNNSPTLITELRSLILAFMERDIIQKKDGYEMLRELT